MSSNDLEPKLIYIAPVSPEHDSHKDPIPLRGQIQWGISLEDLLIAQKEDKFCKSIRGRIQKEGPNSVYPYYIEMSYYIELLMRYIDDNKQRFEATVVPKHMATILIKIST